MSEFLKKKLRSSSSTVESLLYDQGNSTTVQMQSLALKNVEVSQIVITNSSLDIPNSERKKKANFDRICAFLG